MFVMGVWGRVWFIRGWLIGNLLDKYGGSGSYLFR